MTTEERNDETKELASGIWQLILCSDTKLMDDLEALTMCATRLVTLSYDGKMDESTDILANIELGSVNEEKKIAFSAQLIITLKDYEEYKNRE